MMSSEFYEYYFMMIAGLFCLKQGGGTIITCYFTRERNVLTKFLESFRVYFNEYRVTKSIREGGEGDPKSLKIFDMCDNQFAIYLEDFDREKFVANALKDASSLYDIVWQAILDAYDSDELLREKVELDHLKSKIEFFCKQTIVELLSQKIKNEIGLPSVEAAICHYAAEGDISKVEGLVNLVGKEILNASLNKQKTALDGALNHMQLDMIIALRRLGAKTQSELEGRKIQNLPEIELSLPVLQAYTKQLKETEDPSPETTLRRCAAKGLINAVKFLVEEAAVSVNAIAPSSGKTALDFAIDKAEVDMIIFLRQELGAKLNSELSNMAVAETSTSSMSLGPR